MIQGTEPHSRQPVDDGERSLLPAYDSVRTVLHDERLAHLPKLPVSIDDVLIEGQWAETLDGERFLLPNSPKDLLLFQAIQIRLCFVAVYDNLC